VDVDTTAVGRRACSLVAPGVEALSEQPAERLRSIIRLDLDTTGCQWEVTTVFGVLLEDRGGGRLDDATCNLSAFLVMDHHSATQHIVISETRLHFLG